MRITLANCNESSLSSLIKTPLTHHIKFKTTIVYFIITCGAKMVSIFAVHIKCGEGVTLGMTSIKDVSFEMLPMTEHNFLVKEPGNPRERL